LESNEKGYLRVSTAEKLYTAVYSDSTAHYPGGFKMHYQCPHCEIGELYYTGDTQDIDGYYHCYEMRCPECGERIWDDSEVPGHERHVESQEA
jgi:hypothetical protein